MQVLGKDTPTIWSIGLVLAAFGIWAEKCTHIKHDAPEEAAFKERMSNGGYPFGSILEISIDKIDDWLSSSESLAIGLIMGKISDSVAIDGVSPFFRKIDCWRIRVKAEPIFGQLDVNLSYVEPTRVSVCQLSFNVLVISIECIFNIIFTNSLSDIWGAHRFPVPL